MIKGQSDAGMLQFEIELELRNAIDEFEQIRRQEPVVDELLRLDVDRILLTREVLAHDDVVIETAKAAEHVDIEIEARGVVEECED